MSAAAEFKEKGNAFLQAGKFDEAIDAYTKAIEINPNDHVFFSNRSAAYLSKGDARSALNDGEKCVEISPSWAKGYSRKGAALHALKRYDEAVATYNDGLTSCPNDQSLLSALSEVNKAKTAVENAEAGFGGGGGPGGLGGLFGPKMLSKLAGHPKFGPKLSDQTFMRKLQLAQTNPQLLFSDPELMEVLQLMIGDAGAGGDGGDDEQFSDEPPQAYSSSSSSSTNNSKSAPPAPEPDRNLSEEERAARKRKADAAAAKERGNALYKEKKFDEAIAAYDEAFSIDNNMLYLNNKAAVYIELCRSDEAIALCQEALEIGKQTRASFEDRAKVFQRIAAAHIKKDDIPAALEAYGKAQMEQYDKAVERKAKTLELEYKKKEREMYINPELGVEAKERGNAAFRDGDFPKAILEYEDAIKRDPTNAAYHNNLAAAFIKVGSMNDAKRNVEKSLELDKTYVKAWAKKGDIEFFMKEYHKATDSYKAGLVLEPENALCKQGLQKTIMKINESSYSGEADAERVAHARADPEIQMILSDPSIQQVLRDLQENPKYGNKALQDPIIRAKIEKLIAAGILGMK